MSGLKRGENRQFVPLASQDDLTAVEHSDANDSSSIPKVDDHHEPDTNPASSSSSGSVSLDLNSAGEYGRLHRGLSARQVQMIAIAGRWTRSVSESIRMG